MKHQTFITVFALLTTAFAAFAKPPVEEKLMTSARRAVPRDISTNEIIRAISSGLWNSNKTAVAVAIPKPKASLLFVFLRKAHGEYLAVDVSSLEGANIGYLGPDRRYDRIETTPLKWLHRDDGLFQIQMRTRAWASDQRYTAAGTILIKPDGTCISQ